MNEISKADPADICKCNHSRLNHDPECGWDDCECRAFKARARELKSERVESAQ